MITYLSILQVYNYGYLLRGAFHNFNGTFTQNEMCYTVDVHTLLLNTILGIRS
jgi:hypothetical protein